MSITTRLRLPDFIIAGAPRSGTQWLYSVADRHPEIEMAKPLVPEPKFFLRPDVFERGLTYYSETWFAGISPDKRAGEKSTNYLEDAQAAQRIHECLPDVRLVFMLRNPVDRAYSNYLWSRQNGMESEDFETALELETQRDLEVPERLRYARPHALFSRGLYAELLRPYLRLFPREQLLVLRYEDVPADAQAVAASLHRFLGVEPRPQDGALQEPMNAAINPEQARMHPATRERLSERYAEANAQLYDLLGRDFPAWEDSR